jgi:predicted Holliday junction resolvase-like endonuclease
VTWLNEVEESTSFYDVRLESPSRAGSVSRTIFVEVKTTRSRDKNVFEMSPNEWRFASRPGVDYRVYRVFSAGDSRNVSLTVIKDPARLVENRAVALCLAI